MKFASLIGFSLLAISVLHTGCTRGANDPEPETALTGAWQYVGDLTYANGNQCEFTFVITIDHREGSGASDVFTGFAEDGGAVCWSSQGEELGTIEFGTAAINHGLFNPEERRVNFDLSTDLHHSGTLENDEISGRVEHDPTFGWGEGDGTFVMTRPPSTVD